MRCEQNNRRLSSERDDNQASQHFLALEVLADLLDQSNSSQFNCAVPVGLRDLPKVSSDLGASVCNIFYCPNLYTASLTLTIWVLILFICLFCYNKMPNSKQLIMNRIFFLMVLGIGKSKMEVLTNLDDWCGSSLHLQDSTKLSCLPRGRILGLHVEEKWKRHF